MDRHKMMDKIAATLKPGESVSVWVAHSVIQFRHAPAGFGGRDGADCYTITPDGYQWTDHKWGHGGTLRAVYAERVLGRK